MATRGRSGSTIRGGLPTSRLARASGFALLALLVAAVGGYAGHWRWTGFQDNDTLWDWLNLVLLPLTLAVLPLWSSSRRRFWAVWRLAYVVLGVAFVVLVVGGYVGRWTWTGFAGNTLWDWLKLLLVPFVLPLVVSALAAGRDAERPGE